MTRCEYFRPSNHYPPSSTVRARPASAASWFFIRDFQMPKVFERITAIREPNQKEHMLNRNHLPNEIKSLLASAGIAPGGKIPLTVLDAALAKLNYNMDKRLATKALLGRFRIIEL
jgi:hypothetical protein